MGSREATPENGRASRLAALTTLEVPVEMPGSREFQLYKRRQITVTTVQVEKKAFDFFISRELTIRSKFL